MHTFARAYRFPMTPNLLTPSKSYLAIHLPDSAPPAAAYTSQMDYFLTLSSWGIFSPVIYIATPEPDSGAVKEIRSFARTLPKDLKVLTLRSLLIKQRDTQYMKAVGDPSALQLAVLDIIMVENAAYFVGIAGSEFARTAAVVRAGRRGGEAAACRLASSGAHWKDGWSETIDYKQSTQLPTMSAWVWP